MRWGCLSELERELITQQLALRAEDHMVECAIKQPKANTLSLQANQNRAEPLPSLNQGTARKKFVTHHNCFVCVSHPLGPHTGVSSATKTSRALTITSDALKPEGTLTKSTNGFRETYYDHLPSKNQSVAAMANIDGLLNLHFCQ